MIIEQEQLASATGYERPADIARCLQRQGIRVFRGKNGRVFCYDTDFDRQKKKKGPDIERFAARRQG